ncbi:MAG: hypothetical protein WC310_00205 [Patescibacteria group bacterium]|jgi:hypothetical protein
MKSKEYFLILSCILVFDFLAAILDNRSMVKKLVLLAVLIVAVFAAGFIFIYFINDQREETSLNKQSTDYYDSLAEGCPVDENQQVCCLLSVGEMRQSGFLLVPQEGCPQGQWEKQLDCAGSYKWCRVMTESDLVWQKEEKEREDELGICRYEDSEYFIEAICNQLVVRLSGGILDSQKGEIEKTIKKYNGQYLQRLLQDTYWVVFISQRDDLLALKSELTSRDNVNVFFNVISTVLKN